jgi:small-conductance mechanosensitive channel
MEWIFKRHDLGPWWIPVLAQTSVGQDYLREIADNLARFIVNWLPGFGSLHKPFFGNLTGAQVLTAGLFLVVVLVLHGFLRWYLRRKKVATTPGQESTEWRPLITWAASRPAILLLWFYGTYFALAPLLLNLPDTEPVRGVTRFFDRLFNLGVFIAIYWFFFRLTRVFETRLGLWAKQSSNPLDDLVVRLAGRSLRIIIPVMAIVFALPLIGLSSEYDSVVRKGVGLLLIGAVAWMAFQITEQVETFILGRYDVTAADNLQARKVHTQVQVLKKTIHVTIAIVTVASAMMLFDDVRRLGTSILASAGVLSLIIGFAAQRSIANLFAGLQLALTQPIRLDDVVIVAGEWGRIEEVTLTYVVVRIWDLRRLVVPLSHFIEQPFQNWTRTSSDILGTVFLYTDYTVPVEAIREELTRIVKQSSDWDQKVCGLQVTNASERTMELRALASAADASKAWNLRCEIREKLIAFVQKNYPGSLPKVRAALDEPAAKSSPSS